MTMTSPYGYDSDKIPSASSSIPIWNGNKFLTRKLQEKLSSKCVSFLFCWGIIEKMGHVMTRLS